MIWKPNKEGQLPTKPGYYLTFYLHPDFGFMFKAFSFHGGQWYFQRFKPDVVFWWDKHFDFYVPCQEQREVDPVPGRFQRSDNDLDYRGFKIKPVSSRYHVYLNDVLVLDDRKFKSADDAKWYIDTALDILESLTL